MNGKTPEGQLAGSKPETRVPQPTDVIVKNQPIDVRVDNLPVNGNGQPIDVRVTSNLPPSFTPGAKGRAILVNTQSGNDADNFFIDKVYGEWVMGQFGGVRGWFRPGSSSVNGSVLVWMGELVAPRS